MQTLCVIPARYSSTRLPAKPLIIMHGKPMVQWVWETAVSVFGNNQVIVATDDIRILDTCKKFGANVELTGNHSTATSRLHEISTRYKSDAYVLFNGDEPLVDKHDIQALVSHTIISNDPFVSNLMCQCSGISDVLDPSNLKVVTDVNGNALCISRSPIPYPHGEFDNKYDKFVGVGVFNSEALNLYVKRAQGRLELSESNDSYRFIEHGTPVKFIRAIQSSMSVDTERDVKLVSNALINRL